MYPLQKVPHVLQNSTNNKLPTLDNFKGPGLGPAEAIQVAGTPGSARPGL